MPRGQLGALGARLEPESDAILLDLVDEIAGEGLQGDRRGDVLAGGDRECHEVLEEDADV